MSELVRNVVVIGAGQAGGWAAKSLRAEGFEGRIALIGSETFPPYERPPLSKEVLLGERSVESTILWSADDLKALQIETRLGAEVSAIDLQTKSVVTSDREKVSYDRLLIATGSRVRKLAIPESDSADVRYLRTIEDAVSLRSRLVPNSRLLVVGGGWIGLEVAASARQRDVKVVLVEAAASLCSRSSSPELSEYLYRLHAGNGVDIKLRASVSSLKRQQDETRVVLSSGEQFRVDSVVAGIGVVPNVEVAEAAGLQVSNGIVVDELCQTSDRFVFAAGDVTNSPNATGGRIRLESWANAQNQAIAAARNLLGGRIPYQDVPWFWSDQYGINIQLLGHDFERGELVARLDSSQTKVSYLRLNNEVVTAAICIDCGQDVSILRRLIQRRSKVDGCQLSSGSDLRQLLAKAAAPPVP